MDGVNPVRVLRHVEDVVVISQEHHSQNVNVVGLRKGAVVITISVVKFGSVVQKMVRSVHLLVVKLYPTHFVVATSAKHIIPKSQPLTLRDVQLHAVVVLWVPELSCVVAVAMIVQNFVIAKVLRKSVVPQPVMREVVDQMETGVGVHPQILMMQTMLGYAVRMKAHHVAVINVAAKKNNVAENLDNHPGT